MRGQGRWGEKNGQRPQRSEAVRKRRWKRRPEKGACYLADRGVWINLIRGGEEQSAGVREAPVESSKLINTVAMHLGCVCNQTVEMH